MPSPPPALTRPLPHTHRTPPTPPTAPPDELSEARPARPGMKLPPPKAPHSEAFRALGVGPEGLDAIAALGFDQPTPIQEQSLPILLEGRDVVGLAQTGTGKTLAFGLPLVRALDPNLNAIQA